MNDRAQLIRELQENGFHFVRTSKHASIFRDSYGESIGIANTPSDWRNTANTRALIKAAVAKRPLSPPEPIEESKMPSSQDYVIVPKNPLQPVPQDHLDVKPDPAVVAGRKQCKVCKEFKTLDRYSLAGPTRSPLKTCKNCISETSISSRKRNEAARTLVKMEAQVADIKQATEDVSQVHPMMRETSESTFKDEANAATPVVFRLAENPTPRPPKRRPNVIETREPERMATRVLVSRHKEEYDLILTDMLTALGWGE